MKAAWKAEREQRLAEMAAHLTAHNEKLEKLRKDDEALRLIFGRP